VKIVKLENEINDIGQQLHKTEERLTKEIKESKINKPIKVTLTAYTKRKKECKTNDGIGASMRKVKPGTVAVSRDLFRQGYIFGRKIYIEGIGVFTVNDLTHRKYSKTIDIYYNNYNKAVKFGRKESYVSLIK
jgi:3D (Asp-Asp-Asp) domain-containing protein